MKLDIENFEFKNITKNIYKINYNNNIFKFWTPKILIPFGLENEYNKYLIKIELDKNNKDHNHLKKVILNIENIIKKKLNVNDNEFKSIISTRKNENFYIDCKIKTIKNNIITSINFEDKENNYLKTIFEIPKYSNAKVQLEINGIWDYRNELKEDNKIGLIIYINEIIIM